MKVIIMNNYFNYYYYYHDGYSSNDVNGYYPITIVKKDSNLLLTLPP